MKKAILIMVLVMLAVFIAGCKSDTTTDQTGITTGTKFVGGTEGIALSFVTGTPPERVADQEQPFGISVQLENRGDHDVENTADATVMITGIDPADFGVSAADMKQDTPEQLLGASIDTEGGRVSGTLVTLDFPASGSFQHQQSIAGQATYNVRAEVCYAYGTIANSKLCILEDLLGKTGKESQLCQVTETKAVDGSGAPVQVTEFKESVASSNKVAFVFKVSHVGTGTVHKLASECDDTYQQRDIVGVEIETGIAGGSLTCSGMQNGQAVGASGYKGDVTLLNGEREVRCTQTVNDPTDVEKLVRVDLAYEYKQHVDTQLTVEHFGD